MLSVLGWTDVAIAGVCVFVYVYVCAGCCGCLAAVRRILFYKQSVSEDTVTNAFYALHAKLLDGASTQQVEQ